MVIGLSCLCAALFVLAVVFFVLLLMAASDAVDWKKRYETKLDRVSILESSLSASNNKCVDLEKGLNSSNDRNLVLKSRLADIKDIVEEGE